MTESNIEISCKHCGRPIVGSGATSWMHVDGPQRGKIRCAITPYGYNAAPADEPCDFTCNGHDTGAVY